MILIIDHYDSFVYNLARYLRELGAEVDVKRPHEISIESIHKTNPSHLLFSPGPCSPHENEYSNTLLKYFAPSIPTLGVCLGHQCIGQVWGGRVIRAPRPVHGKTSEITHQGKGVFQNIPSPLRVTRYHSLLIDSKDFPDCLEITAQTADGIIMGVQHKTYPVHGVQFHPEAHLSMHGHYILQNFLNMHGS